MALCWKKCFFIGLLGILCLGHKASGQDYNQQFRLARELEAAGQWDQAREIYEDLLSQDEENPVLFHRLKDLYVRTGEYERAMILIRKRMEGYPEQAQLEVMHAQMKYKMGLREEALEAWRGIVDRAGERSTVYHLVAGAMIEERLLDEAVGVYMLGRERTGRGEFFAYNLGMLHARRMEYGKATEELLEYLAFQPRRLSLVESQLLQFPRTERVIHEMIEKIGKAIKQHPDDAGLTRLMANVLTRAERFDEALEATRTLERLTGKERQGDALFLFAQKTFLSGNLQEAKRAYQIIQTDYPEFSHMDQVLFGVAQCYEAEERFEEASDYYESVYEKFASKPLAPQALHRQGSLQKDRLYRPDKAMETFQALVHGFPGAREKEEGRLGLADCSVMLGDLDRAEVLYKNVMTEREKKDGLWLRGVKRLSDVAFYRGRFEEALSFLDEMTAKDLDPSALTEPEFNDGLSRRMLIAEHHQREPGVLGLLALGERKAFQRQTEEAAHILDSLSTVWPNDPLTANTLFRKGELEIDMDRMREAKASFDTLLSRFPDVLFADQAMERLGWILESQKRWRQAVDQYEALLTSYPHSLLAEEVRGRIRRIEGDDQ